MDVRRVLSIVLALGVVVPASVLIISRAKAAAGCSMNGIRYSDGARVQNGGSCQRCMAGQWAPRKCEACAYPLIAASPAGGVEPCIYGNRSYPDGGLLNAGGVCQLCSRGIWIERDCAICQSQSLVGTWKGPTETVTITPNGSALNARFSNGRGPFSGTYTGPSAISFNFGGGCCTGTVTANARVINWSNRTTWTKQ